MKAIWIKWGFLTILKLITLVLSAIVYPIVYLFRYNIYKYTTDFIFKDTYTHLYYSLLPKRKLYTKWWFWMWCFLCEDEHNMVGNYWYMKNQKEKWFDLFYKNPHNTNKDDLTPIPKTFIQKLQYFWISYRWAGLRNQAWNFSEWFLKEGKGYNLEFIFNIPNNTYDKLNAKFKDKNDMYMDNTGPYIRYPFDDPEHIWKTTYEGMKYVKYTSIKKNKLFIFSFVQIIKLAKINRLLVLSYRAGWNAHNGLYTAHFKNIFLKLDDKAMRDYHKYQSLKTKNS